MVQNLLKEKSIKFVTTFSVSKAGVVELLTRTMKVMLKQFTKINTRRYTDALPDLVVRYHNCFDLSIKMKPVDVDKQSKPLFWINLHKLEYEADEDINGILCKT